MLASELINIEIPSLQLHDSVGRALQLINDFRVTHLPVTTGKEYIGLISEDNLLEAEEETISIESLQNNFITTAINETQHFLTAVNYSNQLETTIVPVINKDKEFKGVITGAALLKALGDFSGAEEMGGIITFEMKRQQFSISEISRIVESNDATVLHLNTTIQPETGMLLVTIILNKREIAAIIASFERFEYNIVYYFGNERFESDIQSNFRHLMNYLDI